MMEWKVEVEVEGFEGNGYLMLVVVLSVERTSLSDRFAS